ncbi:MAG: hypothetical protein IKN65_06875 [Clostridia bacterium]|nr:hypothetical protein [Clostridia bacterium]
MIPATTPTFILRLKNADGYLADTISMRVDIRQQDVLIQKNMEDLVIDTETNSVGITLTQKETAKFLYKKGNIEIQIHGLLSDGETAWKTYVVDVPVDKTLSKEVITDGS